MAQLNPAQIGYSQTLMASAREMIIVLANTGSGQFTESVLEFQRVWNQAKSVLGEIATAQGWYKLVEDGLYGPNTSGALFRTIGPEGFTSQPPRYAAKMPTWYAANRDVVDAMAPMQTVPVDEILDPWQGEPTYDPSTIVDEARSGSLATEVTSRDDDVGPSAQMPTAPSPDQWCDQYPEPQRSQCFRERYDIVDPDGGGCFEMSYDAGSGMAFDAACDNPAIAYGEEQVPPIPAGYHEPATEIVEGPPADALPAQPLPTIPDPVLPPASLPMSQLVEFDTGVPIVSAPQRGRVPFIAIAIGALALGGGLVYMARTK